MAVQIIVCNVSGNRQGNYQSELQSKSNVEHWNRASKLVVLKRPFQTVRSNSSATHSVASLLSFASSVGIVPVILFALKSLHRSQNEQANLIHSNERRSVSKLGRDRTSDVVRAEIAASVNAKMRIERTN